MAEKKNVVTGAKDSENLERRVNRLEVLVRLLEKQFGLSVERPPKAKNGGARNSLIVSMAMVVLLGIGISIADVAYEASDLFHVKKAAIRANGDFDTDGSVVLSGSVTATGGTLTGVTNTNAKFTGTVTGLSLVTNNGPAVTGGTFTGATNVNQVASAGTFTGGTRTTSTNVNQVATGGTYAGGTATGMTNANQVATAGTFAGGTATGMTNANQVATAGTFAGGTATGMTNANQVATAGTFAGGTFTGATNVNGKANGTWDVTGAGSTFTSAAVTNTYTALPTSTNGLPTGCLWNSNNYLMINL